MVTAHREIEPVCVGVKAALDLAHAPPVNGRRISILLVAGNHTALATNALRHVEVKAILLACLKSIFRDSRKLRSRRSTAVGSFFQCCGSGSPDQWKSALSSLLQKWQHQLAGTPFK
jgi:hypothetical protein